MGDLKGMIRVIGLAVVFSLLCVAGNAMAMSMRERTTEVAVLKAIGFDKGLILFLVLTESILVAGLGGVHRRSGVQGPVRGGRHLAVHGRASCRSSTSRGAWRSRAWPCRSWSGSPAGSCRPCGRPTSRSSTDSGGSSEPP